MSRPHGYARYRLDGCRCYTCGFAASEYERKRQAAKIAGTWQPYMPAQPVRDHLAALGAAGVGYKTAAKAARVSVTVVRNIIYGRGLSCGRPGNGQAQKVKTDTARRLLALVAGHDTAAPGAIIPAVGTTRRIQAMCAMGWPLTKQAEHASWSVGNYAPLRDAATVLGRTARTVAAVYDHLAMTPPPESHSTSRAKKWAAARHYLPPMVWDDDEIDDPAAVPCVLPPVDGSLPVDGHALTVAYLHRDHPIPGDVRDELVRRMYAGGYSHAQIAPVARTTKANVGNHIKRLELAAIREDVAA